MSWRTHGEDKYNGIARALIEMEYYDEARQLLEKGLQEIPGITLSPCRQWGFSTNAWATMSMH